eukprot:394019-Pleurochrysis_carterae.AAC.1
MVAFTIGRSNALEGFESMQLPAIGTGNSQIYERSADFANDTRRLMKEYFLTSYVIMAIVVITSSQPSTHGRIGDAYHTIRKGVNTLRSGLARAAEMRHHAPHGLAMCSILFVLMALVTRGDAAIDDHFAHVR